MELKNGKVVAEKENLERGTQEMMVRVEALVEKENVVIENSMITEE
jgi:hypothetical protein